MLMLGLDLQGWITVLAGVLLALITLFTGYDHVDIPGITSIRLNQQVGILVILASLATLLGEAQLASRRRVRDQGDRVQAARDRAREVAAAAEERERAEAERRDAARDRARAQDAAAEERERAGSRARRQDRCALAQLDYQLAPGPTTRARLADLIALLREYGELG